MLWSENACDLQSCLCYCVLILSNSSWFQFLVLALQHPCCPMLGLPMAQLRQPHWKRKHWLEYFQLGLSCSSRMRLSHSVWQEQYCYSTAELKGTNWAGSDALGKSLWEWNRSHQTHFKACHMTQNNPCLSSSRVNTLAILFPFAALFCRFVQASPILECFSCCAAVRNGEMRHLC